MRQPQQVARLKRQPRYNSMLRPLLEVVIHISNSSLSLLPDLSPVFSLSARQQLTQTRVRNTPRAARALLPWDSRNLGNLIGGFRWLLLHLRTALGRDSRNSPILSRSRLNNPRVTSHQCHRVRLVSRQFLANPPFHQMQELVYRSESLSPRKTLLHHRLWRHLPRHPSNRPSLHHKPSRHRRQHINHRSHCLHHSRHFSLHQLWPLQHSLFNNHLRHHNKRQCHNRSTDPSQTKYSQQQLDLHQSIFSSISGTCQ